MMTRKRLIAKLEGMNTSDVLVRSSEYLHIHPLATDPVARAFAQLLNVADLSARHYATKRGHEHSSPAWLIEVYRQVVTLVCGHGLDLTVRMVLAVVKTA